MAFVDDQLKSIKIILDNAILSGGIKAKESLIRSSSLINILHETVKHDLVETGIEPRNITPSPNSATPEMCIAGFLKSKNQDVCVTPAGIPRLRRKVTWGPAAVENVYDDYGEEYVRKTFVINIRSQMSSISKNTDTLFERTFAEPMNLHMIYPDLVLGEVYLVPVFEYEQGTMDEKKISFMKHRTKIEKYIGFFDAISGRDDVTRDFYKYERCALLIVDFRTDEPVRYGSTSELIEDKLLPKDFPIEYSRIAYDGFIKDMLRTYDGRFGLSHLLGKGTPYF